MTSCAAQGRRSPGRSKARPLCGAGPVDVTHRMRGFAMEFQRPQRPRPPRSRGSLLSDCRLRPGTPMARPALEVELPQDNRGPGTIPRTQLAQDAADVFLDGVLRENEPFGNLAVAGP